MPHPFDHRTPTLEELRAYAEGRLDAAAQRAVEGALEADPLLRDAVEGLRTPGALTAWEQAPPVAPRMPRARWPWVTGGAVLIALTAMLLWPSEADVPPAAVPPTTPAEPAPRTVLLPELVVTAQELAVAEELPQAQQRGHGPADLHLSDATPVAREEAPERLAERVPDSAVLRPGMHAAPLRTARPVPRLLYLHDLKLAHPDELYRGAPLLPAPPQGVDASHADRQAQQQAQGKERYSTYEAFMSEALAHFTAGGHKACLQELQFLLQQYPDDVNALFYSGLCCFNLGLYDKALVRFDRTLAQPSVVFAEEAQWYRALTLQRVGRTEEARSALQRIAAGGGFYAAQAAKQAAH
ncbi:MAG: hypothetical protein R2817_13175 [Flavobacteriales bacterium]